MPSNSKRKRRNLVQLIVVLLVLAAGVFAIFEYRAYSQQKDLFEIKFTTATGDQTSAFYLEVAANNASRERGLMYRKPGELRSNEGMMFIFPFERQQSFWMRNTYISLDMIFVNKELEIVGVLHDVPILNSKSRSVSESSTYVVELLAGTAKKHGITKGSKLVNTKPFPPVS